MKCALLEYNTYHGETLPTLVYLLNRLGVTAHVYCSRHIIENNPFFYTSGLSYSIRQIDRMGYWLHLLWNGFRGYDFVIANSLEPETLLDLIARVSAPVLGVVHNGSLLTSNARYVSFFSSASHKPVVLAEHIARWLVPVCETDWIAPVFLGDLPHCATAANGVVRLCVQGNIAYDRRKYEALLEAVGRLVTNGHASLRVSIVGRSIPDGDLFKSQVYQKNLQNWFSYTEHEVPYEQFYARLGESAFLLPLVGRDVWPLNAYYEDKLSTSLQIAIAFGIIPIVDRELATLYGIDGGSVVYEGNELAAAISEAMSLGAETVKQMRATLRKQRAALLERSQTNLQSALAGLLRRS